MKMKDKMLKWIVSKIRAKKGNTFWVKLSLFLNATLFLRLYTSPNAATDC